jgi:predicted DCC family thiol-disulfide oxidoreductase YuxK
MVFDGECVLCNLWVAFALRHSSPEDLVVTSRNSPFWKRHPSFFIVGVATDHSVVAVRGDDIFYQSDAVVAVLQTLRAPWRWLSVVRIVPRFLRNLVYRFVARIRYHLLGRIAECAMVPVDVRDRLK